VAAKPLTEPELLIAGGGPAGLACAIAARLSGLSAAVVDQGTPPIDKACGEGLMPGGVAILNALGVHIDPDGCAPFTGIRYVDGDTVAEADFPEGEGLGVRRLYLHRALVARAEELGVALRWKTRFTGVDGATLHTDAGPMTGGVLVAADGLQSPIRRWLGLDAGPAAHKRFGVRRHYRVPPWSPFVEVHWADDCEAYVTPAGPERVGVAFLWSGRKARFDDLLSEFPALSERLSGAAHDSRDRGAGPLRRDVLAVREGRVLLLGDAAGYRDAITGEGLSLAFHQAQALVDCVQRDALAEWPAAHRRICRVPTMLIDLILTFERRPWLRRRVVRALAADPEAFSRFLGVNDGSLPLTALGPGVLARMGWRLLAQS